MVYIRINPTLRTALKPYLKGQNIITLEKEDQYISYSLFKRIAKDYKLAIHEHVKRTDIIMQIQMQRLQQLSQRTPAQKRFSQQLKNKHQLRMLSKHRASSQAAYYFQQDKKQSVKDLSSSISFGLTFIFSFFMAGLTGYYFGTYFLSFDLAKALMVSLVFIIITVVVETSLYIIKQDREIQMKINAKKEPKVYKFKSNYPSPEKTQAQKKND